MTEQQKKQANGTGWQATPTSLGVESWNAGLYAHQRLPLIVFDLDGTLLDSYEVALEIHSRAIAAMGLPPVSRAVLESLNGPSIEQECAMLGLPLSCADAMIAAMERAEAELMPTHARLFPGVEAMLEALFGRANLCLLTNGLPSYQALVCEITGIGDRFVEREGYVSGITKAMRAREWARKFAAPRALMVGDRPSDVAAAREAGATALGVTYGNGTPEEMRAAAPDALAADVDEVLRFCLRFCEEG